MNRKDPYKYFRIEAREISDALNQDVLALEKPGSAKEAIARLLRHAHTLKGASRVMKLTRIAELAHALEEALAPFRESDQVLPRSLPDRLLGLLDGISVELAALDERPPGEKPAERAARPETPPDQSRRLDTVRLEVAEVDAVLERLSEVTFQLALLKQEMGGLERIRRLSGSLSDRAGGENAVKRLSALEEIDSWLKRFHRVSGEALEQAERDLRQAHERAERLRLVPASSLFAFLERTVRDAARTLGKEVRFEVVGGAHRLDAPVLSAVQEALLHIVRNAVAHGIEGRAVRVGAGKASEGVVRVEVERRGSMINFLCRDDGKGIDPGEVRRVAMAKGILPPSAPEPLGMEEAVRILLRGGISTAERVSELAGRGIGLDAVRETVQQLRGGIQVESIPGSGTQVEIRVPYSMSTIPALLVEAGGAPLLVPFECVRMALRIEEGSVARSPEGDTLPFEGSALPVLSLEEAFSQASKNSRRARPGVVLEAGGEKVVLGVDRILGVMETVVRPIPSLAALDAMVAGASLDVEGNPRLVLDPEGLVRASRLRGGASPEADPSVKPAILVIDDSLTTRMLERNILESAGYAVDCAVSGEEALDMARRKRFGLFLVDVEMPGMDGFALLEKFREDAGLRETPTILVTSRSSGEDRRRGESLGARDHIVKGEFDQIRLLSRIKELIG